MLEVIGRNPGLPQTQLAAALALTRPATSLAVDFWEDRGCVERRKIRGDRRSVGVYLTAHGDMFFTDVALADICAEAHRIQAERLARYPEPDTDLNQARHYRTAFPAVPGSGSCGRIRRARGCSTPGRVAERGFPSTTGRRGAR